MKYRKICRFIHHMNIEWHSVSAIKILTSHLFFDENRRVHYVCILDIKDTNRLQLLHTNIEYIRFKCDFQPKINPFRIRIGNIEEIYDNCIKRI